MSKILVDKDVLKQALEALENLYLTLSPESVLAISLNRRITALRAALAEPVQEPVQEPVAWKLWDEDPQGGGDWRYYDAKDFKNGINPMEYFDGLVPLYAAPPQRKPLTEEEMLNIIDDMLEGGSLVDVARAIERAHEICE